VLHVIRTYLYVALNQHVGNAKFRLVNKGVLVYIYQGIWYVEEERKMCACMEHEMLQGHRYQHNLIKDVHIFFFLQNESLQNFKTKSHHYMYLQ